MDRWGGRRRGGRGGGEAGHNGGGREGGGEQGGGDEVRLRNRSSETRACVVYRRRGRAGCTRGAGERSREERSGFGKR